MNKGNPEYQKVFSEVGRLNAELITRKSYCTESGKQCNCKICRKMRKSIKRKVNKLVGRKFYKEV